MSLFTGRQIYIFTWEELPINDDVIGQVEYLEAEEYQLVIKYK